MNSLVRIETLCNECAMHREAGGTLPRSRRFTGGSWRQFFSRLF